MGLQGQRLHLSIYHSDWPAKSTFALPVSVSISFFAPPFYPSLAQTLPASPICPSIFCLQPSRSRSWHPSSSSFSLCVSFCISRSHTACVRTRLKCPEGRSFKHRNQKHMAHFQLPRSITAIYPEIAAKFPKVSSRFTTDCNVCLSLLKPGQFPLPPVTSHQTFQRFSSGF